MFEPVNTIALIIMFGLFMIVIGMDNKKDGLASAGYIVTGIGFILNCISIFTNWPNG